MQQKPSFITFEGIEGCGKTTQINLLENFLKAEGLKVVRTKEPGGCPIADDIRAILLDSKNTAMESRTELLLYAASRAQHVLEVIQPALAAGKIVICDRYADSTEAYQGFARQLDMKLVNDLNIIATGGLWPDLTLWLDIPVDTGLSRAIARNGESSGPDEGRFEAEAKFFHERCKQGFEAINARTGRFTRVDADATPDVVSQRIIEIVKEHLK